MYAGAKHHWVQYMNPKSTFSIAVCMLWQSRWPKHWRLLYYLNVLHSWQK